MSSDNKKYEGKIRWGILGTGMIAHDFANAFQLTKCNEEGEIRAIGSRSKETAEKFAKELKGNVKAHGSYEDLVNDPELDIIYVASPHSNHREHILLALNAGKPVLCEKPITLIAAEFEDCIKVAREKNLFLMEAAWMRYLPTTKKAIELVESGAIGEIRSIVLSFGFQAWKNGDPNPRYTNLDLGAGILLDVGAYGCGLPYMIFKKSPDSITPVSRFLPASGPSGGEYDVQTSFIMSYPKAHVIGTMSFEGNFDNTVSINGTKGLIKIQRPFWGSEGLSLFDADYKETKFDLSHPKADHKFQDPLANTMGLHYEALHAMKLLREGKKESDLHSLEDTMNIMRMFDDIRGKIGLKYPIDEKYKK